MINRFPHLALLLVCCISLWTSCHRGDYPIGGKHQYYANPLLDNVSEPWAIRVGDRYYYTQNMEDRIVLWWTKDLTNLAEAQSKVIWVPQDSASSLHLWAPEIHRIDGKWYVYFTADDGNTDNHHLYVIENSAADPFQGSFEMKGKIQTDPGDHWAIHASVFEHRDSLYLIWSGWQTKRVSTETQSIYIARMENPWTLATPRVMISTPEEEWERQWINPDGTRTAYPIFVNEAPQALPSPNADRLFIIYSASGNWTPYYALGLLWADADADLLQAESWLKIDTPVFSMDSQQSVYSVGSFCPIRDADGAYRYFLYQGRDVPNDPPGVAATSKSLRMQQLGWTKDGFPDLGKPLGRRVTIRKPEG